MSSSFISRLIFSTLFVATAAVLPATANADMVNQCEKLAKGVTIQKIAIKKLMLRKAPRARLARQVSQLKRAQSTHRRAGCEGKVCGDMQPTLCNTLE